MRGERGGRASIYGEVPFVNGRSVAFFAIKGKEGGTQLFGMAIWKWIAKRGINTKWHNGEGPPICRHSIRCGCFFLLELLGQVILAGNCNSSMLFFTSIQNRYFYFLVFLYDFYCISGGLQLIGFRPNRHSGFRQLIILCPLAIPSLPAKCHYTTTHTFFV